ncbi:unnamed protein product [Blepharisma stoltei]|uniref:USP domain-containing protein n=1 Tax=Blepharisma stoltei TaxID=1481888 RepID=A0AAU9IF70_9CILI|nr:unnamed protein product [Blepharisma stoltei]
MDDLVKIILIVGGGLVFCFVLVVLILIVIRYVKRSSNSSGYHSTTEESQPFVQEGRNQEGQLIAPNLNEERSPQGNPINNSGSPSYEVSKHSNPKRWNEKIAFIHNAGIPNYGNTCYLNSTIQTLACIPKFVDLISKSKDDIFKCLSQIINLVLSNQRSSISKSQIEALLNGLRNKNPDFKIKAQNDCKELYNILIDEFFGTCEEHNFFLIKKVNLFICGKGHKMQKEEEQLFLIIPPNNKLDSEKCIQDIKEKKFEDELFCNECGEIIKTRMITESLNLPEYLVFYVIDTSNQGRVPKTYIRAEGNDYDLFGVICYYGSGSFGHYIAFTLNAVAKWIKYNDAFVDEEDPDYDHAYMLFYKQRILS